MPSAFAQQAAQQDDELEEVQITGSRILRRDLESTSPLVTIGQETFDEISNVAVEAALNKLPQFFPGLDQFDTADIQLSAQSTVGATTVNLRNLGANRNLVLINGRRGVPVNASMTVDTNSIPSAALSRVEVITGGASSVYGADAVGGVVNFILRDSFQGIDLDTQYSRTQLGDGEEFRIAGLIGGNFGDDRGNAMLGFEYAQRDDALQVDRDFFRWQLQNPYAPATQFSPGLSQYAAGANINGVNPPSQAVVNDIFSQAPAGSVSVNNTFAVQPDGSLFTYNDADGAYRYNGEFGLLRKRTSTGTIAENSLLSRISSPLRRYSMFGSSHFDITEKLTAYVQGTFSQAETQQLLDYVAAFGSWGSLIPFGTQRNCTTIGVTTGGCQDGDPVAPGGLPFAQRPTLALYRAGGAAGLSCPATGGCSNTQAFPVPEELRRLLASRTANPNADWRLDRQLDFLASPRKTMGETTTYQLVAGFRGDLPIKDWTWDAFASHGTSRNNNNLQGVSSWDRFRTLIRMPNYGRGAAIQGNSGPPGNGQNAAGITCTTGLPIFEQFEMSKDCSDAIQGQLNNITETDQNIVEAVMQGGLFELPAGELRFALGTTYRENSYSFVPDSLVSANSFTDGVIGLDPIAAGSANDTVKEAYVEFLVPVLKDKPFFTHLNFELGYRHSDYESTGKVSTYKALLDWAFTPDLRLRGGYQRANRSPNLAELFTPISDQLAFGPGDPCGLGFTLSYGANPATNPAGAARVRALCEAQMGATGAAAFYAGPQFPQGGFAFQFQKLQGNPNLTSEIANTYTAGLVLRSPFQNPVANFTTSLDWYSIEIEDAISLVSLTTLTEQCYREIYNPTLDPNNQYCLILNRNQVTGGQNRPAVTYNNVGTFEVAGLDFSFNWAAAFEDMGVSFIPGRLSFGMSANYTLHDERQTLPNTPVLDQVGYAGFDFPWQAFSSLGYSVGGFNASLRMRHYPAMDNIATRTSTTSLTQGVGSYNIYDLSASYFFGRQLSVRAGIDNLMDVAPPVNGFNPGGAPGNTFTTGTLLTGNVYDVLGRRFYVGVKVTF